MNIGVISGRVRVSSGQGVGWIVFDNPAKHNAVSISMWNALVKALAGLERDEAIRCVVIRGEGDRAFCAGADVSEKQDIDAAQSNANLEQSLAGMNALKAFGKPLLAMISGYCLGGGMAIALSCDLRIAAANASFGIPAAKLSICYPYREVKRLVELVGPSTAKRIVFTADRLVAGRALAVGLVDDVVPTGELLEFTTAMAARIAANAPLTLASAKQAIALALSDPPGRDVAAFDARNRAYLGSEDYAEAGAPSGKSGRRSFAAGDFA